MLFFDIVLLKAIDDKILIFAAASFPSTSEAGLFSANPNFLASLSTSEKLFPKFLIMLKS